MSTKQKMVRLTKKQLREMVMSEAVPASFKDRKLAQEEAISRDVERFMFDHILVDEDRDAEWQDAAMHLGDRIVAAIRDEIAGFEGGVEWE